MRLGKVIRMIRAMDEKDLGEVAGEIGIAPATLSSVERGGSVSGDTMIRVMTWLLGDEKNGKAPAAIQDVPDPVLPGGLTEPAPPHDFAPCPDCDDNRQYHVDGVEHCIFCGWPTAGCDGAKGA